MTQRQQMLHPESCTGNVVTAHGVDPADPTGQHHQRHLGRQLREQTDALTGPDEDQPPASVVDQRSHRPRFAAVRGHGAEDDVITQILGGDVDTVDEVGDLDLLQGAAQRLHDREQHVLGERGALVVARAHGDDLGLRRP